MKKSNKFIVVLFLFITAALVLFNVLLNAQLKKGNFRNEYNEVYRVTVDLKPFRHVVYEGRMDIEHTKNSRSWEERTIKISTGENLKYTLEMPSNSTSILDHHYQGDTLYISFKGEIKRFGRADYVPESSTIPLQLNAPGLSSISASYGMMDLSSVNQLEPLALYIKNTQRFTIKDMRLPVLRMYADTNSQISVAENTHLDTMVLSMGATSAITFNTPIHIKTIEQGPLHATAKIGVKGSPVDMKTYLQKTQ